MQLLRDSAVFAGSGRLLKFLEFIVEETLAGRAGQLKEAVIGNAIYGREPAYDPRIDSAVRVEARRLRRKLDAYFEQGDSRDTVRIEMPTGRYGVLFQPLRSGSGQRAAEAASTATSMFPAGPGAAIAVLPFRCLSDDPVDQTFAAGVTDELIFALEHAPGLHVVSRGAAFGALGPGVSLTAFASALGVDALVQGTVRRGEAMLRVTVEVTHPNGYVAWSDRFDAPDHSLLELQEKIAATMLNRLRLDNSRMRAGEVRPGPQALAAFSDMARARQLMDRQTPDGLRQAMALFERIAVAAPDYARAQAGIADCACDMVRLGMLAHKEAGRIAGHAAQRALELDPQSIEAHASKGTVAAWLDFDAAAAESWFRTALALGDNARAARIFATFLTIRERHDEAESMFAAARRIEPFSQQQDTAEAVCHYQSRRFAALLGTLATRPLPGLPAEARLHIALADILSGEGRVAADIAAQWHDGTPLAPLLGCALAEIEARLGQPKRGRLALGSEARGVPHFALATLALALGDESRAFVELEAAIDAREPARAWIRTDARLDAIRGTAAFDRIEARYADSTVRSL